MPLAMDEISDDFDAVKTSSHMLKLDTETSVEVLHAIINNMELETNPLIIFSNGSQNAFGKQFSVICAVQFAFLHV